MIRSRLLPLVVLLSGSIFAESPLPKLPGIGAAMQEMVDKKEMAGAITVVATKDQILHWEATGFSNIAEKKPMTAETIFWIASMSKPITGTAVMMLVDERKLRLSDPVAKYIPEFANLKTPSGKLANLTMLQILTHTSGLGEATAAQVKSSKTLADLVPIWLAAPMQYEPGEKWKYTQSGINAASRVVEVISGMSFDAFLQKRLFDPLGMKSTTFYPTEAQRAQAVTAYAKNKNTGELEVVPQRDDFGFATHDIPPQGNGGLYSTAGDYTRFCQMLLSGGTVAGHRYLSPEAVKTLSSVQTGSLPTGFFQSVAFGNHGGNYGWGVATCVLKEPHEGAASVLSPGSFGHGGAWGTQAWIDPAKGVIYLFMVQRSNFSNSDASEPRRVFQQAAAAALGKK